MEDQTEISHGSGSRGIRISRSRICHGLTRNFTEIRPRISRSICHGRTRNYTEISRSRIWPRINTELHGNIQKHKLATEGLNKRGQVSFSALNIFCSWFRLTAEKETWPLLLFKSINEKKKWWRLERQTHPAQWVGLKAFNKSGGG